MSIFWAKAIDSENYKDKKVLIKAFDKIDFSKTDLKFETILGFNGYQVNIILKEAISKISNNPDLNKIKILFEMILECNDNKINILVNSSMNENDIKLHKYDGFKIFNIIIYNYEEHPVGILIPKMTKFDSDMFIP